MKVLFFAQGRQLAGCDAYILPAEKPLTAPEFWARLGAVFPALLVLQKSARLARNESYLEEAEPIQPDDEIAVIPPVSGG